MMQDYDTWAGKIFRIHNYECEVINVLAEGGYSLIFKVKWKEHNYALKRQLVNNSQMLAQINLEIYALEELKNFECIVPYIDSIITKSAPDVWEALILLELCESPNVFQLMSSKPEKQLTITEINEIFLSAVQATAAMHHHNPPLIHRDIKIENIISYKGKYVLCDFGSVTNVITDPTKSCVNQITNDINMHTTLPYRSPEMIDLYSGKLISTKADIWALGCLLYKLFYYVTPFGDSTIAIINAVVKFPYHPVIPDQYRSLIGRMLDPDPDSRPYISEVANLAFSIANKENPICKEPLHAIVPLSGCKSIIYNEVCKQNNSKPNIVEPVITSVAPRSRPKVNCEAHLNTGLLASDILFTNHNHSKSNDSNLLSPVKNNKLTTNIINSNTLIPSTSPQSNPKSTDLFGNTPFTTENNTVAFSHDTAEKFKNLEVIQITDKEELNITNNKHMDLGFSSHEFQQSQGVKTFDAISFSDKKNLISFEPYTSELNVKMGNLLIHNKSEESQTGSTKYSLTYETSESRSNDSGGYSITK